MPANPPGPVISAKLFAPPLRPQWVPRPRLTRLLAAGLARPLTVVAAPAGFGKSTLVSEWRASPAGRAAPLAWLSLDAGDNDPARFLAHLVAALAGIRPGVGETALALLHAPTGQHNLESVMTSLVNDLAAWLTPAAVPAHPAGPRRANGGAALALAPGGESSHGPAPAAPAVLALDDYHTLTEPALHEAVTFLLEHLPVDLRLLLLSRSEPPLPLARLRAQNALTEIRAADLSFTLDEATDFFQRVMGLDLAAEQVAALERRTEGWAAGLQLAALALQAPTPAEIARPGVGGSPDAAAFVAAFTGSHRFVLDYLVAEVLQRQPPEVQTFLVYTSILDRLSAGLCQALFARPDPGNPASPASAASKSPITSCQVPLSGSSSESRHEDRAISPSPPARSATVPPEAGRLGDVVTQWKPADEPLTDPNLLLAFLDRQHLFLIPLDGQRQWYRYHHLFAQALREQLRLLGPELERALHLRASRWLETRGQSEEAIGHALAAGDTERAARLIDPAADRLIRVGELTTIRGWIEALPPAVVRADPALCIWYCWTLLNDGRHDEVETYLRAAERALRAAEAGPAGDLAPDQGLHEALSRQPLARQRLAGQIAVIRCNRAMHQGDEAAAGVHARQALAVLPPGEPILRAYVSLILGHQRLGRGEAEAAEPILTAAHEALRPCYHPFMQFQVLETLVHLRMLQGRLHAAHALGEQALALAAEHRLASLTGAVLLQLGFLCVEQHDFERAEAYLEQGARLMEAQADPSQHGLLDLLRARLAQARGDREGAGGWLAEAVRRQQRACGGQPSSYLAAWQGRFWLQQGDLAAAKAAFALRAPAAVDYAREFENLVLVRLYLAEGRPAEALALAKTLRAAAEAAGRSLQALRCQVLQALAHQALNQAPQARRVLERALGRAAPEGFTCLFLDEGPPLLALLAGLSPTHPQRAAVERLLALAGMPPLTAAEKAAPATPAATTVAAAVAALQSGLLLDPLSAREQEILGLLAAGLSNHDIAERLVVAVSTVRWYTKQLYRKLDVHNRTQAVLRAQALGLV